MKIIGQLEDIEGCENSFGLGDDGFIYSTPKGINNWQKAYLCLDIFTLEKMVKLFQHLIDIKAFW